MSQPDADTPHQIIHLDLDAFYCAVEEQRDPTLCGQAFAVGGRPEGRGVVASCSYAARKQGVRSAMPMARAIQLCPKLKIVSPHFDLYRPASRNVMSKARTITSLVEQISIDEVFIDVSDLPEDAEIIGRRLQAEIRDELGLPNSLGIATNKLVAKIANDVGKAKSKSGAPPNALTVVSPGTEADFLAPLPVEMLWGVGPKTAGKLALIDVQTIGDLAKLPDHELARRFGKNGWDLARRAKGIDKREIVTEREAKSISQETTFEKDVRDGEILRERLIKQSQRVTKQLRKQGLTARTVKIKIRWPDFTTLTRQITLERPTDDVSIIFQASINLFNQIWNEGKFVRLLGMGVSNFDEQPRQLGLWDPGVKKDLQLQETLSHLQERFGEETIWRGFSEEEQ
jgi:DNA polymerase IV